MLNRSFIRSDVIERVTSRVQALISSRNEVGQPPELDVLIQPEPRSIRSIALVLIVAICAIATLVWINRPIAMPSQVIVQTGVPISDYQQNANPLPSSISSAIPLPSSTSAISVVVDVEGAVRYPGLRTFPPDARVADAIAAAGGLRHSLPLGVVNLAAKLVDGQLLVITSHPMGISTSNSTNGSLVSGISGSMGNQSQSSLVNLNTATTEQLDGLPGVGPVMCSRIIEYRNAHTRFASVDDLQNVQGIGPKLFAQLAPLVTV